MGGHVWANNNEQNEGATFSFCFPRGQATSTLDESIHGSKSAIHGLSTVESGDLLRILLVDDSRINLKVLERMLNRLGVKKVRQFSNAEHALAYHPAHHEIHKA